MNLIPLEDAVKRSRWSVNVLAVERRYQDGLTIAARGAVLHITARGSWSVDYPARLNAYGDGWITSSGGGYEIVAAAFDANEDDPYGVALVHGVLDGGGLIVDHRGDLDGVLVTL